MWINFVFLYNLWKALKASNKLKIPTILLLIKASGPSIDLSTCVSAAKLNIASGLKVFKIFKIFFYYWYHT